MMEIRLQQLCAELLHAASELAHDMRAKRGMAMATCVISRDGFMMMWLHDDGGFMMMAS